MMSTNAFRRRKFLFIPLILLAIAAFSAATMALWNALMPVIFQLPVINFWQAMGLLVLARLLFGIGRPCHRWGGPPWKHKLREKVSKMSSEEREAFFKRLRDHRRSWHGEHFKEEKETDADDPKTE